MDTDIFIVYIMLPSPDRPNSGGADSKYFIGPLKAKKIFELKNIS